MRGLTIPGLANAHSHAFQRALRGRTQAERGDFWTWRRRMYEIAERIDPDLYLALARATFGEMALAGITAVGEFHYLHHGPGGARYEDPNALGKAVIAAAREAGIRITLLDTCYLHGGIGQQAEGVQLRFSDGSAEAWAERVDQLEPDDGARIGAAIHSVRAVDPEAAARIAAFAAERSWPLHAHVSEQPAENEDCVRGLRHEPDRAACRTRAPSRGASPPSTPPIWPTADFDLLGGGGCGVCLCPTTERDLADGVGPARRLAEAGARALSRHRLPRAHRRVRGGSGGRARRAPRERGAGRPLRRRAAPRRDRGRLRRPRMARGRQDRAAGRSPTS